MGDGGEEEEAAKVERCARDVVFEQTRDTRVLSLPLSTRPLSPFVSSWNNRRCVFTSLPLLRLSTLPILSVSFLSPPFFPPFFFVSFHNGGLHRRPLTPRPGVQED